MSIAVAQNEKRQMGGVAKALQARAMGGGRAALNHFMTELGEPKPASNTRAMREWRARNQPRYRIGDGKGLFLRLDGQGVTAVRRDAWIGGETQMRRALACFAAAQGLRGLKIVEAKLPVRRDAVIEMWGAR
jgi:hypothetical protein